MDREERQALLFEALKNRILVIDGAMGTSIQALHLSASDFGGSDFEGCNENLVLTKPEVISKIHDSFFEAGANILETNTFGATPLVLAEYSLEKKAAEINRRAAELARKAVDRFFSAEQPRFVAGSMGPTTKAISVTGGVGFEDLINHYELQAQALYDGDVDFFLIETIQDTRNLKAALLAIDRVSERATQLPVAVSVTIEPTGTMLAGQTIEAFWASVHQRSLLYIGLNCATGPSFMTSHLRSLAHLHGGNVACVPNAGLPDENGTYLETPRLMADSMEYFAQSGWLNLMGGCCGTTPEHIRELARVAAKYAPHKPAVKPRSVLSGIDFLEVNEEDRPVLVGERTNSIGSRKFKSLIASGDFENAAEVARAQVRAGASVVDICLANPDRNELEDMERFLGAAIKTLRAPLMIDSTHHEVIARALTYSQGKAIINSINLEDGEERFQKVIPLARSFGAALVVGTIDDDPEQGMGITLERKLEIAERSFKLLTEKYDVDPSDIYWDALVFPCGTGDPQYTTSAPATINAVRELKKAYPLSKTILGISNVSFGLPPAGREIVNSVFLYHCVQAGLDLAIVNSEMLHRYPSIPEEERVLAEDLLFHRRPDALTRFVGHFREKAPVTKVLQQDLPLDDRIAGYIVEGTKLRLKEDLDLALQTRSPLEIINGPLMKGMDEVGRLFNTNQLIVAEVLQSAEVMKAAVAHLEPFMEKSVSALRGTVILATVKGDVHDIGKNLVDIILTNNGFKVVNLGIKVASETLIDAVKTHHPHIIGLSGLLVKSAEQMVLTAQDLSRSGISVPMLVGGAALTRSFTDRRIAKAYTGTVAYASDAMNGLELAKVMIRPEELERLKARLEQERANQGSAPAPSADLPKPFRTSNVVPLASPPQPPDYDRHVLDKIALDTLWNFVNPRMLFGRHLGLPNRQIHALERGEADSKTENLKTHVDDVKTLMKKHDLGRPRGVFRFFHARSTNDELFLQAPQGKEASWVFPRQNVAPFLCLSDYVGRKDDNVGLFVVTAGHGVREFAEKLKAQGEYLKCHILAALALETAEAFAEYLHMEMRRMWRMPDPPQMTMMERFQAKYRGRRYSFGYPACPDLSGQALLWNLISPQDIGVSLTDGFMMDPEASVSALVFHHPDATYFTV